MRIRMLRRFKKAVRPRKKKAASPMSRTAGAIAVFATAAVFIGAAMLMSARASTPAVSPSVLPPAPAKAQNNLPMDAYADMPAAETPRAGAAVPGGITVTGCLERDGQGFRLKDTDGADLPRARSWKSGFLRKRSATIAVADAGRRLKLPAHVGERVSVTGTLIDRDMQARSLKRVAASCGG